MSDTGGGHRSAAEAISAALHCLDAGSTVELLDFFATCAPFPINRAGDIYGPWVNHAAWLWGAGFDLTNGRRCAAVLGSLISRATRRCVEAKLRAFAPDVLACVHPLATQLAADVRRRFDCNLPSATIVTDLVTAHVSWFSHDVELLVAPSPMVRVRAMEAGILSEKIVVAGQPVHPRFTELCANQRSARESIGLTQDCFTVLLIGGGEGMGRVAEMARAIDKSGLLLQQVVVCGRNEKLRCRLEKMTWQVSTHILGFVHNMPMLMHAADVVVTKAGPSTICEALVVGRPILLTGYVPGQERGNVDFVVDGGAGQLTQTPRELVAALRTLIDSEGEVQRYMTVQARRLARPSAAMEIAQLLLSLAYR